MKIKVIGLFFILVSSSVLTGCAGKTVLLTNKKGDLQKCEVSTTGAVMGGVIARNMAIDDCVEQYEAIGYKKVK
jgi:hypothetical protein